MLVMRAVKVLWPIWRALEEEDIFEKLGGGIGQVPFEQRLTCLQRILMGGTVWNWSIQVEPGENLC